ncbi:MAG: hypothetical protein RLY31_1299 [Bacteroidota bacterium]|jgi:peroxiredoxin
MPLTRTLRSFRYQQDGIFPPCHRAIVETHASLTSIAMKKQFLLLMLMVTTLPLISFGPASTDSKGLEPGDTAPDFSLRNVDGRMVSLASLATDQPGINGFIVVFTCNTCPYSVMYEDRIIDLHQTYASKGWPVVAIQPNDPGLKPGDSAEEMKIRAREKGFPFVYLLDEDQRVFPAYGATRTPTFYLLDADRTVRYIGALDNNPQEAEAVTQRYVESAIQAVVAGHVPDPTTTKAIGCGIKMKS